MWWTISMNLHFVFILFPIPLWQLHIQHHLSLTSTIPLVLRSIVYNFTGPPVFLSFPHMDYVCFFSLSFPLIPRAYSTSASSACLPPTPYSHYKPWEPLSAYLLPLQMKGCSDVILDAPQNHLSLVLHTFWPSITSVVLFFSWQHSHNWISTTINPVKVHLLNFFFINDHIY